MAWLPYSRNQRTSFFWRSPERLRTAMEPLVSFVAALASRQNHGQWFSQLYLGLRELSPIFHHVPRQTDAWSGFVLASPRITSLCLRSSLGILP